MLTEASNSFGMEDKQEAYFSLDIILCMCSIARYDTHQMRMI